VKKFKNKSFPLAEWAFHTEPRKQFGRLSKEEEEREWKNLWEWEFYREKYNNDEEFSSRIVAHRKEQKILRDKIELHEGTPRSEELRTMAIFSEHSFEHVVFPLYVPDWPEKPYLSIDQAERLEFTDVQHGSNAEYPDLELSQPASGRKCFEIWIDPTWPEDTAKKKFWDWFKHNRELLGGESIKVTAVGKRKRKIADLKALGAVRLKNFFLDGDSSSKFLREYAEEEVGKHLYAGASEYSKAYRHVEQLLLVDRF
jgi:hypothetical protein